MAIMADAISGTAGEDVLKYRLLKLSAERTFKYCQPGEQPVGVNEAAAASGATDLSIHLLTRLGSIEVEAHEAIAVNAPAWPGPNGRLAASGVGRPIGVVLTEATAQGDVIELLPMQMLLALPSVDEIALFDDFLSYDPQASSDEKLWKTVLTDTGANTLGDAKGGRLAMAASDGSIGDNDENYLFTTNELFLVEAGKPIYFETRIKLAAADTDGANVQVGLMSAVAANAIQDNGAGPPASYDGVVAYKVDGGSAWAAEASVGATQTPIALTAPGAPGTSYQKIGILVVPTSATSATAYIFVNGVLVGSQAFTFTGMTEMSAFVGVKNGGTAVNTTLHVDYVLCRQAR